MFRKSLVITLMKSIQKSNLLIKKFSIKQLLRKQLFKNEKIYSQKISLD
jgi:hypothetical protein